MAQENLMVGEILKQAREDQGLTLEEVSLATKIKEKYLVAIEAENWEALPSSVQIKGFTRSYASFLKLDPASLITDLRAVLQEEPEDQAQQPPPSSLEDSPQPKMLDEIGSVLKAQRNKLGISIPNVEDQIYIPSRYLEAIENGNLEELPSTVQGKGMVKNYAQFLGLDPDPLLLSYADVLRSRLDQTRPEAAGEYSRSQFLIWWKRFIANPTLLWAGVVIVITTVTIWAGALLIGDNQSGLLDTPTIPAVADILLPTSTATATLSVDETPSGEIEIDLVQPIEGGNGGEGQEATPTPVLTGNEKIQLQLNILQRTWVRVKVDNVLAFEGRLIPGSVQIFGGEFRIEVLTGNAGGIEVIYNQQSLGVMGLYGQVISRVYTAQGVATPTSTITLTPTPSETPEPSLTPTPTTEPE
jgi:cytoskeletal protein RodZ